MSDSTAAAAILGGFFATAMIILIAWYVLLVIAWWKVFTKAGEAGWKALIPFYNVYTMYKICWKTSMFWIYLALIVCSAIFGSLGQDGSVYATISSVLSVVATCLGAVQLYYLSVAFGHGLGYTFGLFLLNPIFMLILGFGSSQYVGPQKKTA